MNLAKELHGRWFETRLGGIVDWNDRIDLHLDDTRAGVDPTGSFDSVSVNRHGSPVEVIQSNQHRRDRGGINLRNGRRLRRQILDDKMTLIFGGIINVQRRPSVVIFRLDRDDDLVSQ